MPTQRNNPFTELYVTETIPPEDFVALFSPYLIKDVLALFQPGNIVLKGVQGSGKSMLLNLLKPEIRIAYKEVGMGLPAIPGKFSRFIGAGINLTRSVATDFGQRAIDPSSDPQTLPLYFGDFINYWVIDDIFRSLEKLRSACHGAIAKELEISDGGFDRFAKALSEDPCWFGYFRGISTFSSLKERISDRIFRYRAFLNFNGELPEEITRTKTTIGEPISKTVRAFWTNKIVPRDVLFFIRIDQYEELSSLEDLQSSSALGHQFRAVVNKALAMRDPYVSYRIGSRRYAWEADLNIFGTGSVLESERNYKVLDIDAILRRGENRKFWAFPGFAEDVFERRLQHAEYHDPKDSLRTAFGPGLTPEQKVRAYARTSPEKTLVLDEDVPAPLSKALERLYQFPI